MKSIEIEIPGFGWAEIFADIEYADESIGWTECHGRRVFHEAHRPVAGNLSYRRDNKSEREQKIIENFLETRGMEIRRQIEDEI